MRYNQLGNTELFVSEICLGTMTFGEAGSGTTWDAIAGVNQKAADQIVERSLATGVNFIDTADVYSFGESERLLGQALKNLGVTRKDVVIATKVFGVMGGSRTIAAPRAATSWIRSQASLERLQTDHIDLYQIHANDPVTPIDETLRALDDLVRAGLVRYVGVSNWPAWRIAKALGLSERRGFARFETAAGLLLHRRPRPGARHRADDDRGEARPDGLVAAGRRLARPASSARARPRNGEGAPR